MDARTHSHPEGKPVNPQPTKQALTAYRSWLQKMVTDTQAQLDRDEGTENTVPMLTAWEGALKTFDAHFPGNSKPEHEPAGDVRTLDLRSDLEALQKARTKTAMPLIIRVEGPLQITINN